MLKFAVDLEKSLELGLFLKKARENAKLTTHDVSKLTSISPTDINYLENGKRMRINPLHLIELSNIYKINVLKLYEMIGYIDKKSVSDYEKSNVTIKEIRDDIREKKEKMKVIPLYSSVSAGTGAIPEGLPVDFISIPLSNSDNLRAAYVKGDSMTPTLPDRSIVIFDPFTENFKDNDIGIFYYNGEMFIKRFYTKRSIIVLSSDNPHYTPIVIDEKDEFKICGKYVAHLESDY